MKLRHTVLINRKNGQEERTKADIEIFPVTLGRGGSSDIVLPNRTVALEHLRIGLIEGNIVVEDISRRNDLIVNGAVCARANLKNGDKIKFGGIEFSVSIGQGLVELIERRTDSSEDKIEEAAIEGASRLQISSHLPSVWKFSLIVTLVTFGIYFILPIAGFNRSSWSSGPISSNHKMIEQDCAACHSAPFRTVPDEKCLTCHVMTNHTEHLPTLVSADPSLSISCAECHGEHNGNHRLVEQEAARCVTCHSDIKSVDPKSTHANVSSFSDHPEFRLTLFKSSDSDDLIWRRLDDRSGIKDPTPIKLNHKVHLAADLAGPDGSVTLNCNDCHRPDKATKGFSPISFERDCKSCHPLTFDSRMPTLEVPHGEPEVVFNTLYAEYAQVALGGRNSPAQEEVEEDDVRQKPGISVERDGQKAVDFARASIVRESRQAERELFTKTACHLCHIVTEKTGEIPEEESSFTVLKPRIPDHWMRSAQFSHVAHDEVTCESCHKTESHSVRESTDTEDALMPGIAECKDCHGDVKRAGKVQSECVMCHSYHDSIGLRSNDKRSIEDIVVSLNRRR